MSFMQYEFPNASYYNDDLREIVNLYRKLTESYNGLQDQINDVLEYIDTFQQTVDQTVKDQIAISMSLYLQRLLAVEQMVNQLNVKVDTFQEQIDVFQPQIDKLRIDLERHVIELRTLNNELREEFHEYKHNIDEFINERFVDIETKLYEIATHLDHLDVINPINGKYEDINVVLHDIVEMMGKSYGITAREYDALGLTAGDFDRMKISAIDYETKAYFIFWELKQGLIRSPFTGKNTHYSNVIYQLANLHKCTFTAKQYDDLTITAADYDAWKVNAFNYDWFGQQMVLKKEGATAAFYDGQKVSAETYDKREITAYQYDTYGKSYWTVLLPKTCDCMACNHDVLQALPNI